jgi:predicted MPP superfamily phosphohydrolase
MAKRIPLVILLWFGTDLYFYQAIYTISNAPVWVLIYWGVDLILMIGTIAMVFMRRGSQLHQVLVTWLMGLMLLVFIPRLVSLPVLLVEDISRLFRGFPARSIWVSELTLAIASLVFFIVLFGITRGKHFYRLRRETVWFPDLPEAFDGFTITQITDVHSGSFTDAAGVQKGLDLVNDQQSDIILFTGDLINNHASEMEQWIPAFSGLKAPLGKFSILGNHDYGDYVRWKHKEAKEANLQRLKEIHAETGFRLLLNETIMLKKDGQSIALVGVENWGKGGFHKYGDLKKATEGLPSDTFRILMSHDPSHWEGVTLQHDQHIHLTLSGHTHGMQFGIEFLGFRWSPIKYVYKQWAGLYHDEGRYLYVNRGFGFLGLKGRIGMWPEVAVITLRRREM